MKAKRDREEACFTCGHYHDYENGEPCGVCGHVLDRDARGHDLTDVMPTTIVPGFLYLGSYDTASRAELLKAMNITHVLNTVPTCQALFRNTFTVHTVSTNPPDFEECFTFLDTVNSSKAKVLVYCMSGISRSPTVVVAYLMKLRGWRLAESYKWVKDKRATSVISPEDAARLTQLELQLHGTSSVPLGLAALDTSSSFTSAAAPLPGSSSQPHAGGISNSPAKFTLPAPGQGFGLPMTGFSFGSSTGTAPGFVFGMGAPPALQHQQQQQEQHMEM